MNACLKGVRVRFILPLNDVPPAREVIIRGDEMKITPVSKAQIAELSPLKRSAAETRSEIDALAEKSARFQTRWLLGLAIANGGALTALSSKVLDALSGEATPQAKVAFALAYPSLWFFAIGFVLVGAVALFELVSASNQRVKRYQDLQILEQIPNSISFWGVGKASKWAWCLELASAAAFVGGLVYPLIVLGVRYGRDGSFTW